MGEVYRAGDPRLQREVAVKVLPARLASDPERLKRFEREARSASALNHPNIVTIHEIGRSGPDSFIVMELVEGRTLREPLPVGALPLRKARSIAAQVADGLARAHAAGIVHRDIKPENVMVSSDGVVKILDFGLAKLTLPDSPSGEAPASTIAGGTESGQILGTVGYMSPELAAAQRADFRSDQFSFGAVLYEMLTGRQAFERPTRPETLAAIIREEPEPIASDRGVPSQLRWIVERCLAKDPKERYAATDDLARDLATLREHLSELPGDTKPSPKMRRSKRAIAAILAAAALVALGGVFLVGRRVERKAASSAPRFRQLTFRGAGISSARFAPDGQTVVYAAQWEGKQSELFTTRLDNPETRPLGLSGAEILSISSSGRMALLLAPRTTLLFRAPHSDLNLTPSRMMGVLAEASLAGGAPRELLEDVSSADWSPDARSLAVGRLIAGKYHIEFPEGRAIFEGNILSTNVAVSPSADRVAFGYLKSLYVSEPGGGVRDLKEHALEIVWHPATNEIWFNTVAVGTTELFAVVPGRPKRLVAT